MVGKVFAVQAFRPEFSPQQVCEKPWGGMDPPKYSVTPRLVRRDGKAWGSRPASLHKLPRSRLKGRRQQRKAPDVDLWRAHTCMCTRTHKHTHTHQHIHM